MEAMPGGGFQRAAPDESSAEGRWFWGQYQELGFDVKMQRASSDATLLGIDRPLLKTGSQSNRIRLLGDHFPPQVSQSDLNFGSGVVVRRIVSNNAKEVIAEVDVAIDASVGKREIAFRRSVMPGALAVYDRIDYIKVTPDSAVATFGDQTRSRGYQQFEAIGYQNGPDGKRHTDDDVELGPVDDGKPLVGKAYLVVTVAAYTFNGRRYVRDLDRWVDDGPARPVRQ